jgi:hypothetical protein
MSFWDVENPTYALETGPGWLELDEKTGHLAGTPDTAGEYEVIVRATIRREVRVLNPRVLSWGREQVDDVRDEFVGQATQGFVITVLP